MNTRIDLPYLGPEARLSIDGVVVFLKLTGPNSFPPRPIFLVPANGRTKAFFKSDRRAETKPPDLFAVQGVAPIMSGTVRYRLDHRRRLSERGQNRLGHRTVRPLFSTSNVIGLPF